MQLDTRTIDYISPDKKFEAHLVIGRADREMGFRRAFHQATAQRILKEITTRLAGGATEDNGTGKLTEADRAALEARLIYETDPTVSYLRAVSYPDLMAATKTATLRLDGAPIAWPLTFEVFVGLPEYPEFDRLWFEAVYDLNAHWLSSNGADEQKKSKKATGSTRGSRTTKRR